MFSVRRAIRFPSPIAASDSVFMYLRAIPLTALRNMALRLPSRGFTHSCARSRLRYGLLRSSICLMTEYALRRVFNVTPARHALFGVAHASARWDSINEAFTCWCHTEERHFLISHSRRKAVPARTPQLAYTTAVPCNRGLRRHRGTSSGKRSGNTHFPYKSQDLRMVCESVEKAREAERKNSPPEKWGPPRDRK
jgi:hypothetical protein